MGQKVNSLIFRSIIFKNYVNNFYFNISKRSYYLINILIIYFLFNNMYKIFSEKFYFININFFVNKFIVIFFIYKNISILNFKYVYILLNFLNFYYYFFYKYICFLKIKYINIININIIMFYIKIYYIKYKSLKLMFNYLYNNIIVKENNNIKGLKIKVSGRLKNSLKTKTEVFIYGILSLNTLNKNIKYINDIINTKYGVLSIKIWLNN